MPSAFLLYCMNTSFQISKYLPQEQAGEQSGPQGSLSVMMNISVSGPHGPVIPAGPHQLFSLGRKKIWSSLTPHLRQSSALSSSRGQSASPAKTENEVPTNKVEVMINAIAPDRIRFLIGFILLFIPFT